MGFEPVAAYNNIMWLCLSDSCCRSFIGTNAQDKLHFSPGLHLRLYGKEEIGFSALGLSKERSACGFQLGRINKSSGPHYTVFNLMTFISIV